MTKRKGVTNWGSSLQGRCGKSMRWQLWHTGLGDPVSAFWEGPMLMIKEGASPFGSVLGSPFLEFHSQSVQPWLAMSACMRIESLCSAFWSLLPLSLTLCYLHWILNSFLYIHFTEVYLYWGIQ